MAPPRRIVSVARCRHVYPGSTFLFQRRRRQIAPVNRAFLVCACLIPVMIVKQLALPPPSHLGNLLFIDFLIQRNFISTHFEQSRMRFYASVSSKRV